MIGSGSDTKTLTVADETMPILQTSGDVVAKIFTSTIDISDFAGQVDGEIFIRAINTGVDIIITDDPPMIQDGGEAVAPILEIIDQVTTSMLEDINQVATPMLEEIDGFFYPIIGA